MAMDSLTSDEGAEMKSHMLLLRTVLNEMGTRCCTSTIQDFDTILERVKNEGESFLTITLPNFGKDFERGLDLGKVDSSLFKGFSKRGELPRFLGGFLSLIFDMCTGYLVDEPSIDAVQAIRQVTMMFGKVNLPCSDARVKAAIDKFVDCERRIRDVDANTSESDYSDFQSMAVRLFGDVFAEVDRKVYYGETIPKHGPGSTAEKLLANAKYLQREWPERLDRLFPAGEYIFPSWSHFCEASSDVSYLEPGSERPVRIVTVPKTLKTPRIIAIEPTCMQYAQQGICEMLVAAIEADSLVSNFVGFSDQEPNQYLARKGSSFGDLATLDLREASDSVSNQLVRRMVSYFPSLMEGLDATRSRKADVPGHGVIRLAKFASMGSALCFPVEAIVFLTIVFLGIERELNYPLSRGAFLRFRRQVRVYGDDIIVPVRFVRSVVKTLETFGFQVNTDKSFWTGKFRESCGKEYFDGEDVSIVRVREMLPTQRKQVAGVISTVSLRNQMYFAGNWETAAWLDEYLEKLIPFPTVLETSPALGRHSFWAYDVQKWCPHLQRELVKAFVVDARIPLSKLEGPGALLKWFLKRGDEPFADSDHLERAGRPVAVNIKLRWVPSY